MKKFRSLAALCFILLTVFLLASCSDVPDTLPETSSQEETQENSQQLLEQSILEEQSRFDVFCEDLFREEVVCDTITLHYTLSRPEDYGISATDVTLGDIGRSSYDEALVNLTNIQTELEAFNYDNLTAEQQLTYDIFSTYIESELTAGDFYLYMEPLTPFTGLHVQLPVLLAEYTFYRLEDVEDYLLLLEDVPRYFQAILDFEAEKSQAGLFMTNLLADEVIRACKDFVEEPDKNYMIEIFEDKLENFPELSQEIKDEYITRNKDLVLNAIIPAYEALASGMEELKDTGTDLCGLAALPDGKDYYTYLIRANTGSDKTPEEMITWLETSMNQDMIRMSILLQSNPSLLNDYMEFHFHEQEPEAILKELQEKITTDFPACPDVQSYVRYVHESLEESSSPAFYLTPPIDSLKDQFIYVNGGEGLEDIYTTVAHEGYPGHLYQNVYFTARDVSPLRHLLNFPGYSEGWATYVEQLSYGYAEGADEKLISLMRISTSIDLKLSALTDLYVNYKGYTEEELGEYLASNFGVDRKTCRAMYMMLAGDPGNYLSYVIGWMEIQDIRELAEETLGDAFDAKEFHRFILDMGPSSFDVIRDYLEIWMENYS